VKNARDELVRIDDQGQAHPIGSVASQRMRRRQGAFRILPSPAHVVLMRFTGEDGRRDESDGAVVLLGGEIVRAGAMCEIFGLLAQSGWRGELCVFDGEVERSLFFDQGNVAGVLTTGARERLGELMYRFGGISREQLDELNGGKDTERRLGQRAVDRGWVSQEEIYGYLRKQIHEVVYATLMASDGTFFFLDGFDDSRLSTRHAMNASALLMEGVTRLDEIRYFREKIPSSEYVPDRNPNNDSIPSQEFLTTFGGVDGSRSIAELGRFTGLGEFGTTRDVYALLRSNHLVLTAPRMTGGLSAIVVLANDALRRIHRATDEQGRGTALREGLASFASGAGVYDMLFRGAGPDAGGAFVEERVAENLLLVAQNDQERTLRQMLYEYVAFTLFSAGSMLGTEGEAALRRTVGPIIQQLQPAG
jgi:hypothetical protein